MSNILARNPGGWTDNNGNAPPTDWNGLQYAHNYAAENEFSMVYAGADPTDRLKATVRFSGIATPGALSFYILNADDLTPATPLFEQTPIANGVDYSFDVTTLPADIRIVVAVTGSITPAVRTSGTMNITVPVEINCDCEDENPNQTLAELRTRVLRRIGASGMTAVPGPGMAELVDDFLQSSQEFLYREYSVLRTKRFFTWNLQQGVRFYDLSANADECTLKWDPRKVEWVGISGSDEWWQPLRCGIPPEVYSWNSIQGWPQLYEVRQCIEIWPAPDNQAWKLRIKGDFGLTPFTADGDKSTVDSEAIFLHALARMKAHLQQPDARNYESDCMRYIGNVTAGAHQTRRYVPGEVVVPNAIPPVWLPLNGGPP